MGIIGQVKDITTEREIEWKILYFSSLSEENSTAYYSPEFSFSNEYWCVKMYPNGKNETSTGYVSLFLMKVSSGPPIKIKYSLGLKTLSGQKDSEENTEYTFEKAEYWYGYPKFIARSKLFERKADLLPSDVITVFCTLQLPTSIETPVMFTVENPLSEKCCLCGDTVDADNLSVHQKIEKAVKCAECSAVLTLKNWCKHECLSVKTNGNSFTPLGKDYLSDSSKILEDFKQLFLNEKECDVVIRVKDQEFPAHKAILIARSSVFESTFRNEMKERKSGIIEIEDCDPSFFPHFLRFLYCGDSEDISEKNVFSLFVTADKYDVKDLKAECIDFISKNMSVDIFCDAITLALQYSEKDLIKLATDYFAKNLQKIILTAKWESFLAEYTTQGNELFIKTLVTEKKSDM